jgi:hypothetical protein
VGTADYDVGHKTERKHFKGHFGDIHIRLFILIHPFGVTAQGLGKKSINHI